MALDDFKEPTFFRKLEGEVKLPKKGPSDSLSQFRRKAYLVLIAFAYTSFNLLSGAKTYDMLSDRHTPQEIETYFNNTLGSAVSLATKPGRELAYKLHKP